MDYYRPTQAVSHSGPAPQNYMYQPTSTQSNSGMYYQMSGYTQQPSPYAMQPSVSQGNTMVNQSGISGSAGNGRRPRNESSAVMNPAVPRNQYEVPLRMIVDAKYVGAIIGQQGNKIKEIVRESKAKCIVDAQKGMRDPQGPSEKVIQIDGLPENSSKAVVKILEVIEAEKEKERDRELAGGDSGLGDSALEKPSEVELKLRASNQLVGRLIGKQGATIKKIMTETETVIYVSNLPEGAASMPAIPMYHDMGMMTMFTDRTITVKGASIAAISAAEAKISAKLRQASEYDASSKMAYGGGMPMMHMGYDHFMASMAAGMRPPMATTSFKSVKMYVPNNMVGAIIGSKGSHIRGIMKMTGATVRIDGNDKREEKKEEGEGAGAESPVERESSPPAKTEEKKEEEGEEIEKREDERLVHVSGNYDNQVYKAQYAVFAKIAEQQQQYLEEVKLRSEVNVPSRLVGRIIGKGGQNVRELQRLTGAHVKIAEENNPENREKKEEKEGAESPDGETTSDSGLNGETTVRIVGNMNATINVEARIAALISDFNRTSLSESRTNGSYSGTPAATTSASNTAE